MILMGPRLLASERTQKQTMETTRCILLKMNGLIQITSSTLIVGVDIAKFKHVGRAQDYRGVEFGPQHEQGEPG